MAIPKRTRFEVLRRDNYTCRYCRSTDNPLTIDHVTPVSLGGTDDPSNLVAACRDCNAGKASSSPDAEHVAQVDDDAALLPVVPAGIGGARGANATDPEPRHRDRGVKGHGVARVVHGLGQCLRGRLVRASDSGRHGRSGSMCG